LPDLPDPLVFYPWAYGLNWQTLDLESYTLAVKLRPNPGTGKDKGPNKIKGEQPAVVSARGREWLSAALPDSALLYQRLSFREDTRTFGDLVWFAPGLNTTDADLEAVLDAEAPPDPRQQPGQVDPQARKLIEQARAAGWQRLTLPADGRRPAGVVVFNGAGKFAWEYVLPCGLREQVVCDGKTLWHLYPEIGLGAKRPFTRFHHAWIAGVIPWLLPSAADLARGQDVLLLGKGVVAVQPRDADKLRGGDGKPLAFVQMQLVFADGRLVERRLVRMPGSAVLARQCYDADGTVRTLEGKEETTARVRLAVTAVKAPNLVPPTKNLVIVPMPLRTEEHIMRTQESSKAKGLENRLSGMDRNAAVALLASHCANQRVDDAMMLFAVYFHRGGDRRLGLYVLLAAGGAVLDPGQAYHLPSGGKPQFFDVVREHPREPLAMYLAYHFDTRRKGTQTRMGDIGGPAHGFVQRLAHFRDVYMHWKTCRVLEGDQASCARDCKEALELLDTAPSAAHAWGLLNAMWDRCMDQRLDLYQVLAASDRYFGAGSFLAYAARYEAARAQFGGGRLRPSHQLFADLYAETLDRGVLPPVDGAFWEVLVRHDAGVRYADLMRDTAQLLAKRGQPLRILDLGRQARLLGDDKVADEMQTLALAACPAGPERTLARLAVAQHLAQKQQYVRADVLLQLVLAEEPFNQDSTLWRMAATLAEHRNLKARAVACLDHALELEFRDLPPVIHLKSVRSDYLRLLQQYQEVANALALLEREAPRDFVVKVVRAADRWRALDPDATEVCRVTARILQTLGAAELAWDYLTTPLGLRPNEAAPWLEIAQALRNEGAFDLADRAYATAFAAEATNAQILWDRAENLLQAGRVDEARAVYQALATGNWQPRFQGLQAEAKQRLR
jgi:tetratricopeptide (TPR) repeat protein